MSDGWRGLRLARAERRQVEFRQTCLDDMIAQDHRARLVWDYVEGLDLSPLYAGIRSVEGGPGQPSTDPAILMSLWLYATLEGVGSARHLARLCETDAALLWILGGVSTNHHTLSTFRAAAGPALDAALSASVAGLVDSGLVTLDTLAVDGVRVRASAGAGSFRSGARRTLHETAQAHVAALKRELELDPEASRTRLKARSVSAALDRAHRLARAVETSEGLARRRAEQAAAHRKPPPDDPDGPRASATDPDARLMRMPDGGWRPAYNAQLVTEPETGLVVGVALTSSGSDRGLIGRAVAEVAKRYGRRPAAMLADGGYDGKADILAVETMGVACYCPPSKSERAHRAEPSALTAWRTRMGSEEGRAVYARRLQAERPHADMRGRGFVRLLLRGLDKAKTQTLLYAHAHNLLTERRLRLA